MQSPIIAIDLGATKCRVVAPGTHPGCYISKEFPGHSIVTDDKGRRTTPSVLYYTGDPGRPYLIGHAAEQRQDGKYPPVMFAKRHLGTDHTFDVADDKQMTPEEVSAEIIKYLKSMAESRLGQEVKRAVVTVPAYFGLNSCWLTREAVKSAGFIPDYDHFIIQDPVAAALAYTQNEQAEFLRIMVYDLGGGTFDVTILTKSGSLIEVDRLGGDSACGGYDFDKYLADHMISQLQKSYRLELDPEHVQEDRSGYSKLLLEAEQAKIQLSVNEYCQVRRPALFRDKDGEVVDVDLELDRATFESLISDRVDHTIKLCRETLQGANLGTDQLDRIIMVGGSSYIPLIQNRLEQAFNRKPELVEPELCVAIGASVHASHLGNVVEGRVIVRLDTLPSVSSSNVQSLSGNVTSLEGQPLGREYAVEVSGPLEFHERSPLSDDGYFYFELALQPNQENVFDVVVEDAGGNTCAATQFVIAQREGAEEHVQDDDRAIHLRTQGDEPSSQEIFISFKNLDASGNESRDCAMAREVAAYLRREGLSVFFSIDTLELIGSSSYKKAIDEALDRAMVLIAVGTSREHLESNWVRYEWDGFLQDIIEGVKPNGRIFTVIEGMKPKHLPRGLRLHQVFSFNHAELARMANYIRNATS